MTLDSARDLKAFRKKVGVGQCVLARRIRIDRSILSQIEGGFLPNRLTRQFRERYLCAVREIVRERSLAAGIKIIPTPMEAPHA